ncbi:DNA/RNA non-specific endonuclease [Actinopolymorpha alba]|uniref:DNA/RNA non-specific endonuclease n=1 Tax=Actinopolymorpha alba TaxID=533267 RepID=UPI0003AA6440|nr:DNA/RNA non-specific endonuclease [Actinopolymorpha alba]
MARRGAAGESSTRVARAIVKRLEKMTGRRARHVDPSDPRVNRNLPNSTPGHRGDASEAPNTTRGWEPDQIYRVHDRSTGLSAVYTTDRHGRVSRIEGRLVRTPNVRDRNQQVWSGGSDRRQRGNPQGYDSDAGGHMIARELGGSGAGINTLPQSWRENSYGQWRNMEKELKRLVDGDNDVDLKIVPKYTGSGERPDWFKVEYTVTPRDGSPPYTVTEVISNRSKPK